MMNKLLTALLALSLFTFGSCSDDEQPEIDEQWKGYLRSYVVGTWYGELYSEVLNTTEHEDIVFIPFDSPRQDISIEGRFTAEGVALVEHYFNDHLLSVSYRYLYSFVSYDDNEYRLSFYPCNDDDEIEDGAYIAKRIMTIVNPTKFYMRSSGSTVQNNLTYNKQ